MSVTPASTAPVGTVAQHALEALRGAIVSGDLRPGQRIRQDEVAESLGVSIAPVREALATLEQEGQVAYRPRRGYVVTELRIADLEEIYELRRVLEERAARTALPLLDAAALERIQSAAQDCVEAAESGNVVAELSANRRFHFALLESETQVHTMRLIRMLWDSTEAYRALYYSTAEERRRASDAHDRIIAAVRGGDADLLVRELDEHRERALVVLRGILSPAD
jgi:DNA-binding GntR family transcriptional regulator